MTKEQIFDEVRRLPREEQVDVLQRLVEMVAPALTAAEERGLAEALDEADRGDVVDGAETFKKLRAHVRAKQ
jgi:hypothetical protein